MGEVFKQLFTGHPEVMIMAFLTIIAIFRDKIGDLMMLIVPEIVRAKLKIKAPTKTIEKPTPHTDLKTMNTENGGAVRSEAWHWPEMALVSNTENFTRWVLMAVNEQRRRSERVTFNLINICATNTKFVSGWKSAVLRILQDNSVCVTMVFAGPDKISGQLKDLKEYTKEEIKVSGKTSILIREDDRRQDTGSTS